MSMTLWVHTLEGRQLTSHEEDHTALNLHAEVLDDVCALIGVPPISSFLDYTDLNTNMSNDFDEDADEDTGDEPPLDPETGWSYGIDEMTWFPANVGLTTLSGLRGRLVDSPPQTIQEAEISALLAEIDSCIKKLEGPAARDGRFHLAVVM
jgi:hypothetical protein